MPPGQGRVQQATAEVMAVTYGMEWLNKSPTNTSKHHPEPIPNLPPGTLSIQNEDINYYSHTDPDQGCYENLVL